ncbi:hypothetical protein DXG01_007772 [Tephrocybe rancida]|nr:hypothetical protein DXG01_007772 [Tephrocybe rancida]
MHFSIAVFTALALVLPALAAPRSTLQVERFNGQKTGRFIVKLKPGVERSSFLDATHTTPTHEWDVINGFAAKFDDDALSKLLAHGDVESISEDGIMYATGTTTGGAITHAQGNDTNLRTDSIITQQTQRSLGTVAHQYQRQTGEPKPNVRIFCTYELGQQFSGRARWGATFGPYPSADGSGHGTHCAGTAAGGQFGVAKGVSIIAVKVLNDDPRPSGTIADIISGINFVQSTARGSGRPSIASLSFSGPPTSAIDNAVASVPAGDNSADATNTSPGRVASAITVGASNIGDSRSSFSNFGAVVDIFAPGEAIISAWSTSTTAAAHISGIVAILIARQGNSSPAIMAQRLKAIDLKGALSQIPAGTVNELAQNGYAA